MAPMSTDVSSELYPDEEFEAANEAWSAGPRPRRNEICARRRVEALLEERRLARLIDDGWVLDDEEEE